METRRTRSRPQMPAPGLEIRLLGEIQLRRGGQSVALPASKRTRALLGYLAATGKGHSRQALCDLLWEGPDDPRAALRWSLTKLRPLLNDAGRERLKADRDHVALAADDACLDVRDLEAFRSGAPEAQDLAALEAAALRLNGEFLDGLDLPSCYRFHQWCVAERERWGALRRRVLGLAVDRLADQPDRALPYVRALVAVDPLSEASHARLVSLLARMGRRKDAQEHYDYARELLRREMGAPLTGELRPPAPPRGAVPKAVPGNGANHAGKAPESAGPAPARLIGRAVEQAAILASLDALCAGGAPAPLLLLGEPGIGKSRLLAFAAEAAAQRGARALAARCFEAEAVRPYGCWADALAAMIAGTKDPALRRDLGVFLPSREAAGGEEGGRTRLFAAVGEMLAAGAAAHPIVLLIDDLQWIDEASASLMHYLLRSPAGSARLLFIGSARTDEIEDNPWCKRVVGALGERGAAKRLELSALGAADVARFLGVEPGSADVGPSLRDSGGNPLILEQLARIDGPGGGRDLDALVGARVARLDPPARDLIIFASATARDFKPELLGAAMDIAEARLIEPIGRLEASGLFKPSGEGRFDFAHDLIRRTVYRSLSQPRRRLVHRQLARALEAAALRDSSLSGEFAYHASAAGEHALAVKAWIDAGEHCLRVFANSAAADAAARGLLHLGRLPPGEARAHGHIGLLKVKVFAAASPGLRPKPELFEEVWRAVEAAELMGLREDDAAIGWHMISWASFHANDAPGARDAILRAEELSRDGDVEARCQQLAATGRCLLEVELEVPKARAFVAEATVSAGTLKRRFTELDWGRGLIARWDGDLPQAQAFMGRALALARLREDRWREMECLVWMAKIAIEAREFAAARGHCDAIDSVAARLGEGPAPVADALRAVADIHVGNAEAGADLERKLGVLRAIDDKAQLAYVLNQVAERRLDQGDRSGAVDAAGQALAAAQAVNRATEIVVAQCLLARAGASPDGWDPDEGPSRTDDASALSARARAHLERVRAKSGIPTPVQTARL